MENTDKTESDLSPGAQYAPLTHNSFAQIIDTHSHIHGKDFEQDLPEVLDRAAGAGVQLITLIGVDPDDTDRALEVSAAHPGRFCVVAGLHPHESGKWNDATAQRLRRQIANNAICAVGEMGLDYHYDFAPRDLQRKAFVGQMEIARESNLPIVIHCREAYEDCLAILRDFYGSKPQSNAADAGISSPSTMSTRGVLHCYFGTAEQAREAIHLGFMLGVGGSCTFKSATDVHRVVSEIPLEHLVLETDAPYMAPVPHRGKRNESSYLQQVVKRIAELRDISEEEVIRTTTANAQRLYSIG